MRSRFRPKKPPAVGTTGGLNLARLAMAESGSRYRDYIHTAYQLIKKRRTPVLADRSLDLPHSATVANTSTPPRKRPFSVTQSFIVFLPSQRLSF